MRRAVTSLILGLVLVGCAAMRPCPDCDIGCSIAEPFSPPTLEGDAAWIKYVQYCRDEGILLGPAGTVNTYLRNCGPHRDRSYDTPVTLDWCRRASDVFKE